MLPVSIRIGYAFLLSIIYFQLISMHSSLNEISVGNANTIGIVVMVSRYRTYNIILCATNASIPQGATIYLSVSVKDVN